MPRLYTGQVTFELKNETIKVEREKNGAKLENLSEWYFHTCTENLCLVNTIKTRKAR